MTRTSSILVGALLLSALGAREAAAQWNVAAFGRDRNRVYVTFGLDPAFVLTLGYGRVVSVAGHDVQFTGDVGVVTAHLDVGDFRVRLGTQTSLVRVGSVRLTGSANFVFRGTDNTIYRAIDFGSDFAATLGVYRRGWFAAGEVGFDKAIVTHITNSAWYRTHFYPGARDGWYLASAGTFRAGLTSGLRLGRTELIGRAGVLRTERGNALVPPMYASLGMGIGF